MRQKNPSAGQRKLRAWLALEKRHLKKKLPPDGLSESYLLKHFRVQLKAAKVNFCLERLKGKTNRRGEVVRVQEEALGRVKGWGGDALTLL